MSFWNLKFGRSEKRDDYVSVTLTDEIDPYRPKEQLEKVYSRILEVRTDNERTRKKLEFKDEDIRMEIHWKHFRISMKKCMEERCL